ncbi:MAG TPA: 30S ribosomal protein S6 [Candidatus Paceibacterota bacterium]
METVIDKSLDTTDSNLTVYEVSYLLLPSLAEEQVPSTTIKIKDSIVVLGGTVISDENPVLIDLAYPMTKVVQTIRHKAKTGYFGWIKFEMPSEGVEVVKKNFDENGEVLRYLIIKTVRENTLLLGKMKLAKEEKVKRDEGESANEIPEVAKEIVPEDLDKSIDELVVA